METKPEQSNAEPLIFSDEFLKEIGFEHMTKNEQATFVDETASLAFELAVSETIKNMSDECLDAYSRLMEKNPAPEELIAFLRAIEPEFDEILKEEAESLRDHILADVRAVMGSIA
jgi:hypothetical protein